MQSGLTSGKHPSLTTWSLKKCLESISTCWRTRVKVPSSNQSFWAYPPSLNTWMLKSYGIWLVSWESIWKWHWMKEMRKNKSSISLSKGRNATSKMSSQGCSAPSKSLILALAMPSTLKKRISLMHYIQWLGSSLRTPVATKAVTF